MSLGKATGASAAYTEQFRSFFIDSERLLRLQTSYGHTRSCSIAPFRPLLPSSVLLFCGLSRWTAGLRELAQAFSTSLWTTGECKCCNDFGSSPKYQLFVTICIALFLIPLVVYGLLLTLDICCGFEDWECWDGVNDFFFPFESFTYYAGVFVSIVWLVTCISRCCAPCCCQLSDVPCPCPCISFGLLDLCFFVGFVVAIYPVNFNFTFNAQCPEDWTPLCETFSDEGVLQFRDVVLCLGILMLCVALPLGWVKFRKMREKTRENTYPVQQVPQVVGNAVVVNEAEPV